MRWTPNKRRWVSRFVNVLVYFGDCFVSLKLTGHIFTTWAMSFMFEVPFFETARTFTGPHIRLLILSSPLCDHVSDTFLPFITIDPFELAEPILREPLIFCWGRVKVRHIHLPHWDIQCDCPHYSTRFVGLTPRSSFLSYHFFTIGKNDNRLTYIIIMTSE